MESFLSNGNASLRASGASGRAKQMRERAEGPRCRKEKGEGAQGKTTFFFFPPRLRTEEQGNKVALTLVGGSLPGNGDGQEVGERREQVEGDRFP